jgi:hypothetical protein
MTKKMVPRTSTRYDIVMYGEKIGAVKMKDGLNEKYSLALIGNL